MGKGLRSATAGDPAVPPYSNDNYTWDTTLTIEDDLTVSGDATVTGDLTVSGDFTFGNAATDNLIVKGDLRIIDDRYLHFGTGEDVSFEYDEDGDDVLKVTGADIWVVGQSGAQALKFRDTNISINSANDGHLDLDADTSIDLNATTGVTGDFSYSGHKDSQILACNDVRIVDSSDWTNLSSGLAYLAENKSAKKIVIPVHGLKVGDEVAGFRLHGFVRAASGQTSTVDADFRSLTKSSATPTDASVGSMSQVAVATDTVVDSGTALASVETIAADKMYYILVTATTANDPECSVIVSGAEVDVNRK